MLINSLKYVICSDLQSNILPFTLRIPFQARKLSLLGTAGVFDKLYEEQWSLEFFVKSSISGMVRVRKKGTKRNACAERSILIELIISFPPLSLVKNIILTINHEESRFGPKLMPFMVDILLFQLSANSRTIRMCGSRFSEVKFVLTWMAAIVTGSSRTALS